MCENGTLSQYFQLVLIVDQNIWVRWALAMQDNIWLLLWVRIENSSFFQLKQNIVIECFIKIFNWILSVAVNMYMLGFSIFRSWAITEYSYHTNRLLNQGYSLDEIIHSFRLPTYIHFVGPSVGIIFFGFIATKFGRKTALLCMSIPLIVSKNPLEKFGSWFEMIFIGELGQLLTRFVPAWI